MLKIEVEYGISGRDQERIYDGFVQAMLWAEPYYGESDEPIGQFEDFYEVDDISPEAEARIKEDIDGFVNLCEEVGIDLSSLEYRHERFGSIGHDFYLTRQGHGAGFWDRGFGDVGDELTKWAKSFGAIDLYDLDEQVHIQ